MQSGSILYCLGDIVHNDKECYRLHHLGLHTINHDQYRRLHNVKVLLRAHGEPPETYETAIRNNINIIDATCPVVLQLQKRIQKEYVQSDKDCQIAIFGKHGHAEVLGLVGQTNGTAIVLDSFSDVRQLDFTRDIRLFSQTTKPLRDFQDIVRYIEERIQPPATFKYYDTICRQVSKLKGSIEKEIALTLLNLPVVLNKSIDTKSLNEIAEYLYKLTSLYNKFYADNKIITEEDEEIKLSWITLTDIVCKVNLLLLDALGIVVPDKM